MPTMTKHMPVVAAIPNYNMGHHLRLLLPQVLERGYDRVFVLDDGSTDDSVEVVNSFNGAVRLVRAPPEPSCTANRNQIIDHVGDEELIHFIDADMDLPTPEAAAVARDVAARYADRGVGAIGGLVSRVDGSQEPYNYGPVFSLKTIVTLVPPLLDRVKDRPLLTRAVRLLGKPAEKKWPNVLEPPPRPAEAYWLHEGNMLIFSSVFKAIGGVRPPQDAQPRRAGSRDPIGKKARRQAIFRSQHRGGTPLH